MKAINTNFNPHISYFRIKNKPPFFLVSNVGSSLTEIDGTEEFPKVLIALCILGDLRGNMVERVRPSA